MAGGNPDSTRWVVYANTLTADNKNLYSNIYRIIDERNKEARQLERCEKFILYWANHHASETDKVKYTFKYLYRNNHVLHYCLLFLFRLMLNVKFVEYIKSF